MKIDQLELLRMREQDMTDEIEKLVQAAVQGQGYVSLPWHIVLRMYLAKPLHFIGIHQWAHLRYFDPSSNRLINTGRWACLLCPATRR